MSDYKSCHGCKYLVHAVREVCSAQDGEWIAVKNPYSGRMEWEAVLHPQSLTRSTLRPSIHQMRTVGPCGPDAVLWSPNWFRRLLARLSHNTGQGQ